VTQNPGILHKWGPISWNHTVLKRYNFGVVSGCRRRAYSSASVVLEWFSSTKARILKRWRSFGAIFSQPKRAYSCGVANLDPIFSQPKHTIVILKRRRSFGAIFGQPKRAYSSTDAVLERFSVNQNAHTQAQTQFWSDFRSTKARILKRRRSFGAIFGQPKRTLGLIWM